MEKSANVVGRSSQCKEMETLLKQDKSSFLAVTGRRRIGKTFLIDQVYKDYFCLSVTGIQDADTKTQLANFAQKLAEYSKLPIVTPPDNWQQAFQLLKAYLQRLPKNRKQVLFFDELPWMATARSGFIQLLAHLWNDYLSKEKHFILVICGSATSWITSRIINDRGGLHNRISNIIKLQPFTLQETKTFLQRKKINLTDNAITDIYMALGGIPFYLDQIKKGESPAQAIDRLCFSTDGLLKYEYDNLYKALFDYPENHEAIVQALATSKQGLTREEILKQSKVDAGGPYTRAMKDLILSGFINEENPYGKKKRGALYRLTDEYSVFYHKFIKPKKKAKAGDWLQLSTSQAYKIWKGYAFETLCFRHIQEIKIALGIGSVHTETSSFRHVGSKVDQGFQIDLIIERKDDAINICECKYYEASFTINKKYAAELLQRKALFRQKTKTRKQIFTTFITNYPLVENEYALDVADACITVSNLM